MESAIPSHLTCPRTRERRVPDDYAPPFPAWVARHSPSVKQVAMAYFGVQYRGGENESKARAAIVRLAEQCHGAGRAGHHDIAHYVDEAGFDTLIVIAYWDDPASLRGWLDGSDMKAWWDSPQRESEGIGYFREIICPRVEHYETLFSTPDRFEGVAVLAESLSGEIQEHAYWGGARDRIPLSQTDPMKPAGRPVRQNGTAAGKRVRIVPAENLALIRSGQEWTETAGRERDLYLKEMEPVLREGMDYLRDQGRAIGCYGNRYMTHVDASGKTIEKSFGMSFWRSLADLERWSESHPTHLAIFGTFMRIVQQLNFQLKLRLYHEISVVKADEQQFEYINCHPATGMLNSVR
jgi:aldoxime dehydratase